VNAMVEVELGSEEAEGKKVGEVVEKEIFLDNLTIGQVQKIKSLIIQKTRESEKEKLYENFLNKQGKLIDASVTRVEDNYYILDYQGTSIFLPKAEVLQKDNFRNGDVVKIYVAKIDKVSRDAQVVGSRTHPQFVKNIIMTEVEDVEDGVIEIERIVRIPGFKTKVAVRSNQEEIDPVGAIIGVRGNKIRQLMELIDNERIDIIK
jgi:N utilization substance protein A